MNPVSMAMPATSIPQQVLEHHDRHSVTMQEKEQLIGAVMRYMLFRQKQKPDQPVRREELAKTFQVDIAPLLLTPLSRTSKPESPRTAARLCSASSTLSSMM